MSSRKNTRGGRPSKYPPEFRRDAVSLVLDEGRGIADVAHSLGTVGAGTLGNWVRQERVERGEREGLTSDERAEFAELRAECARLRMERDLLKRSLAFWVKESERHEVLSNHAVMKGTASGSSQRLGVAEGSLIPGTRGRAASSPDNAGTG